jgi:enoyl-CoA hydratase
MSTVQVSSPRPAVALVTLDRPERLNAMSHELVADLHSTFDAAVNGPAAGGGLALALASDVRLAAPAARFGVAFVRIGLSGCDIGVSWLLPRLIGASRAFELMLTGRVIDAAETRPARARVTGGRGPAGRRRRARRRRRDPGQQPDRGVDDQGGHVEPARGREPAGGIDLENRTQIMTSMTEDMQEAVMAFADKRPPRFGAR